MVIKELGKAYLAFAPVNPSVSSAVLPSRRMFIEDEVIVHRETGQHPATWTLGRANVPLMLVSYSIAVSAAVYLGLVQDWPWYGYSPVSIAILWGIPMVWGAWEARKLGV